MATINIPDALLRSARREDHWAINPAAMLKSLGLDADPWQVEFLQTDFRRALLNCSRRSGKTTVAAIKALHTAMFSPPGKPTLTLIFAPAGKQSEELLFTLQILYERLGRPVPRGTDKSLILDFDNGSRIVPMTQAPDSSLGFTPDLIIVDEAARVPDDLFKAISPMLALKTRPAKLICLSTPRGKQGYFYREWSNPKARWHRVRKTADDCPRIDKQVIEDDRLSFGDAFVRAEYFCSFEQQEGLVYPEFENCIIDPFGVKPERAWAGCDFGWNNPSAFLVVVSNADDVLYVVEEIYGSRMTDEELAIRVRAVCERWPIERIFCDGASPQSIEKLRRADLPALAATKSVEDGIRAVGARLRTRRLFCFRSCQNLIREMGLYRFDPERKLPSDQPVKEHDNAPDALRYAVMGIDRGRGLITKEGPSAEGTRGSGSPPSYQPRPVVDRPGANQPLPRPINPSQFMDRKPAEPENLEELPIEELQRRLDWFERLTGDRGWAQH
jgi:hypothetical protein